MLTSSNLQIVPKSESSSTIHTKNKSSANRFIREGLLSFQNSSNAQIKHFTSTLHTIHATANFKNILSESTIKGIHSVSNNVKPKSTPVNLLLKKGCDNFFNTWSERSTTALSKEVEWYHETQCRKEALPKCRARNLSGPLFVNFNSTSIQNLTAKFSSFMNEGGWLAPADCKVTAHVAFIISVRDREHHIPVLLRQLIPILKRQSQHFRVFLIEQSRNYTFNKGKLHNIGFKEASGYFPYTCFVFHDVDLIPENDNIHFSCEQSPAHLTVAIDKYKYKLYYNTLFGGAVMFTRDHFEKINGFSNSFWLWGKEDDNLYDRVKRNKLKVNRQPLKIARYKAIKHEAREDIKKKKKYKVDDNFYRRSLRNMKKDGLNSLHYDVISRLDEPLYTHITVNLRKDLDYEFGVRKYDEADLHL